MMDATSFNEEDPVQQHSLPEPERRKPYSASTVGRRKRTIRIAIWSTAGLLIVIVIVAFSLAIVNSTYPSVDENSTRDSSPAANEADLPSEDEGGVDFDYGGVGGVRDSLSYRSADDGGSYNVDNISTEEPTYFPTYEPTYEPTGEPTWDEAHLGLPTLEPTMDATEESTSAASTEPSEGTTEETTNVATDQVSNEASSEANAKDVDFNHDFSVSLSYAQNLSAGIGFDSNNFDGNGDGDSDRDGSSVLLDGSEISSYSAAQGARQRRRRLYRNRRRVLRRRSNVMDQEDD